MNSTLLLLFGMAALSMLTTLRLTDKAFPLLRASAMMATAGHCLAALYILTQLLGMRFQALEIIVTLAMVLISVSAITQALGLILERHYHKDIFNGPSH